MFRTKRVWFFLLPGLLLLLLFYVVPFIGGIRYSLQDGSFAARFVGLENYRKLWQNSMFQRGLRNTLELSLIGAPLLWLFSFLISSALSGIHPYGTFARSTILLPYLAPSSAVMLIWQLLFDYGGPLNRLLAGIGLARVQWLSSAALRVPILMLFLWKNIGLCAIVFLAALRTVPVSLYESAELDGITWLRKTFSITLPLISPSAYLVFVLSWIDAFKIFREVYFLSGAYPADNAVYTLQHYMNNVFEKLNYQMVTSAAYSFAAIVLAIFGLLFFLQQRATNEIS